MSVCLSTHRSPSLPVRLSANLLPYSLVLWMSAKLRFPTVWISLDYIQGFQSARGSAECLCFVWGTTRASVCRPPTLCGALTLFRDLRYFALGWFSASDISKYSMSQTTEGSVVLAVCLLCKEKYTFVLPKVQVDTRVNDLTQASPDLWPGNGLRAPFNASTT